MSARKKPWPRRKRILVTPDEAKKCQEALVEELRKRVEYWQNYLARGGYGAQVQFKHGGREYFLSLCGQNIGIEEIDEDEDYTSSSWRADIQNCPHGLLAEAAKHLPALKEAILQRIEKETAPVREALATVPEPVGDLRR